MIRNDALEVIRRECSPHGIGDFLSGLVMDYEARKKNDGVSLAEQLRQIANHIDNRETPQ